MDLAHVMFSRKSLKKVEKYILLFELGTLDHKVVRSDPFNYISPWIILVPKILRSNDTITKLKYICSKENFKFAYFMQMANIFWVIYAYTLSYKSDGRSLRKFCLDYNQMET